MCPGALGMSTSRLILRFADLTPVSLWGHRFKSPKRTAPLDFEADQIETLLKEAPSRG